MPIPWLSALRSEIGRLGRQAEASILPTFTLLLIPLMGAIGAAIDYSRANGIKANLQAVIDSAVLAGAKDGTSNWAQTALNVFSINVAPKDGTIATPTFTTDNNSYTAV